MAVAIDISGNVSIYPGETATFTCEVNTTGFSDIAFQWIRTNGTTVIFFNKSLDLEASDVGLNQTYYFTSTFNATNVNYTDNNAGYHCNALGYNVSMNAYLTGES